MNKRTLFRNGILSMLVAFGIFFSPVGEKRAEAADFTSSQLTSIASKYIGVKYSYGGTTSKGFDCSGYVRQVFKELGVSLPRSSGEMYKKGTAVKKADLQKGDLVFFKTSSRSAVSHVGIYVGNNKFIHSSTSKGVVTTNINDKYYWGARYVGAKRVADVD
ncbi:C40 family peptidase [Lysinibacillus sp. 54212]|uniref:C40 family peptidase n=1 Tax=Lysinibacillus sp. 54212 TaxID=3119829 RepID=UPI002FC67B4A